jgi:SnoaL-like domain
LSGFNPIPAYLRHLDDGEFEQAAALFAPDAMYIRPGLAPRREGEAGGLTALQAVRGREAILDYMRERGRVAHRHVVLTQGRTGKRCFVEMTLSGFGSQVESLGLAELDEQDRIARYVALTLPVDAAVAEVLFPAGVSS